MAEYTLTLTSDQAHEALKAIELLMRLKLGQFDNLPFALLDIGAKDYCDKRDKAAPHLEAARQAYYGDRTPADEDWKDSEWYRLYNLYQVLRKAIHDAEHPDTIGVDSYDPMQFTDEPLPQCAWENNGGKGTVPYRRKA